ncbi:MAG TPA: pyridoxamine 5'-phosphate oxidase family protein [Pseudonocardiaceae bacterium]|nr:pyridoxamine 5'-phosphate oxidase family protein [Pseudonocardiaceae bacterium]
MDTGFLAEITSETQLREIISEPLPYVANKDRRVLDDYDRRWLASSPLCLVATSHSDGSCDVSPKGDPPGFTLVLDDTTIAIPERPGNRRADGFRNILTNPHAGLIYLIPGRPDTLRINGRARLVRDAPFFDQMIVKGHRPLLALVIEIEQIFYHCPKAFLRSELWKPASWNPTAAPSKAQIAHRLERPGDDLDNLRRYYGPSYATRLYRP